MIAGLLPATHLAINSGLLQSAGERGIQQQMVDAQAGIARPRIPKIVPKGVNPLLGMKLADGIGPALVGQRSKRPPHLRSEQGVIDPVLGLIDV